jgi:predicted nucleotidyltransferase
MPLTALDLPPDRLKKYRPLEAIRRRKAARSADVLRRRRRAALTARKAAELLRSEFSAKKVLVFGSLARHGGFTLWSDIDIAAAGIAPARFFEAVGAVTGISAEFKLDLVDLDTCPVSLREAIIAEGKDV